MTTTSTQLSYSWTIIGIATTNTYTSYTNVVTGVAWELTGNQLLDTDQPISYAISGEIAIDFDPADPGTFIQFNNLSQAEVIAWVVGYMGAQTIANLESQIASAIASRTAVESNTSQYQPLPWRTS
jgi:hypothetical protein